MVEKLKNLSVCKLFIWFVRWTFSFFYLLFFFLNITYVDQNRNGVVHFGRSTYFIWSDKKQYIGTLCWYVYILFFIQMSTNRYWENFIHDEVIQLLYMVYERKKLSFFLPKIDLHLWKRVYCLTINTNLRTKKNLIRHRLLAYT